MSSNINIIVRKKFVTQNNTDIIKTDTNMIEINNDIIEKKKENI